MCSPNKDEITSAFQVLGHQPDENDIEDHFDVLEKYLLEVYSPRRSAKTLTEERVERFQASPDMNLRSLPLSRPGLIQHIKRSCIQAGWLWRQGISNVSAQNPENWGWIRKNGWYVPCWQIVYSATGGQ